MFETFATVTTARIIINFQGHFICSYIDGHVTAVDCKFYVCNWASPVFKYIYIYVRTYE